jgi:hypothetical protein
VYFGFEKSEMELFHIVAGNHGGFPLQAPLIQLVKAHSHHHHQQQQQRYHG